MHKSRKILNSSPHADWIGMFSIRQQAPSELSGQLYATVTPNARGWRYLQIPALAVTIAGLAAAQPPKSPKTPPICSTEIVNHVNCSVQIDRHYPLTLPTIQMQKSKTVTVIVDNPLPYETLSLDLQSAQAVAGTDQTAGFLTAATAQLKGFVAFSGTATAAYRQESSEQTIDRLEGTGKPLNEYEKRAFRVIEESRTCSAGSSDLCTGKPLDTLLGRFENFSKDAIRAYSELQEILGTIPPGAFTHEPDAANPTSRLPESPLAGAETPLPWKYEAWRSWILPELRRLLGGAVHLANDRALATCPADAQKELADEDGSLDCKLKALNQRVAGIRDDARYHHSDFSETVRAEIDAKMDSLYQPYGALNAESTVLANVIKDLNTYYVNIERSSVVPPGPRVLGDITDPAKNAPNATVIAKLFGRQVVYAVNAVNNVGAYVASVPTATQKKAVATITVLYSDPKFEASAGVFFSFLPNHAFANQTLPATTATGLTGGSVVIAQTTSSPTTVPFVGANWKFTPDFDKLGSRRSAFYLTAAIGLNPNNTSTEFAVGPSFSWRSLMFSALYHEGRDLRLTNGETVGTAWCTGGGVTTSTGSTTPACSSSQPAPSTQRFWTGAFAIGISVRIPNVFGGSGSSSGNSSSSSGSAGGSSGTSGSTGK